MTQLNLEALARSPSKSVPAVEGEKKLALPTTIVVRVDKACAYDRFVQLVDLCRANGFAKFQLKVEDDSK
jgi:biopolymer transport protein ExbD